MLQPVDVSVMLRFKKLGWSTKRIARELGISPKTVRKYIAAGGWAPYARPPRKKALHGLDVWLEERLLHHRGKADLVRQELAERGIIVSRRTVERAAIGQIKRSVSIASSRDKSADAEFEWLRSVLQNQIPASLLRKQVGDFPELGELLLHLYDGRLTDRNRSMVVLANRYGLNISVTCTFLGIDRHTCRRYLKLFQNSGTFGLFARQRKSNRKFDNEAVKNAVFRTLHEPPSNYGINRTTWTIPQLSNILRQGGHPVCLGVIRKIIKVAGYRWRKARIVLTSKDPTFSEKLDRVRSILAKLRPDEAFFSIDEFGPFAVKAKPGRALAAPGERRVIPQWQKSRGRLILTAALELSGNQVVHFFSTKKNTDEMIRMMELLIEKYRDCRKLYLSWDAASWHISKELYRRIDLHNVTESPLIEAAPLPSSAQFLNVIESVFSGMARAIIHNSDYTSIADAKAAINRYFEERNAHFKLYPRKAGDKIWGKERELATFSEANNCKDPRFR